MKTYDYLIVGAGLYGSIFAHEATRLGKKCLVIEKRPHIAGNIYTRSIEGIEVHEYGAHIFHTSDVEVWAYINQFADFNQYINSPIANYYGKLYNLPFNMNTFYQLWGEGNPERVRAIIDAQIKAEGITEPKNLEEQALKLVGREIYETLVKGYTEKQWGKKATELPAFIIRRLPVRMTFDNNYFNDRFQGIPIGGYTQIVKQLLEGIEVRLNSDFFADRNSYEALADKIVFTGMIDQYFDYQLGTLEYRSLRFETEVLDQPNYQGNAVVNYTDAQTPFTRIIEHKHFEYGTGDKTVITREYPQNWQPGDEPYYPINDEKNNALYLEYKRLAETCENVIFGGRLAEYKYYDMHQIIRRVLDDIKNI